MTLLFMILIHYEVLSQTCKPHIEGYYMYYANLNLKIISDEFSKTDLMKLLRDSENLSEEEHVYLNSIILDVHKSFPTAETDYLQHIISINANFEELDKILENKTIQINFIIKNCANIPLFESNDYHNASGGSTYHDLIRTNEAWDLTRGDERILIGCTDTHINENHEDLINKIDDVLHNTNTADFHGTAVAGCLVAETSNGIGACSVSYKSKLVFSDNRGSGSSDLLVIAQTPGVRVINISWGSLTYNPVHEAIYDEIRNIHNVLVVASAGNGTCWEYKFCPPDPTPDDCVPCNTPTPCNNGSMGDGTCFVYPASYDNVISVTSVGHSYDIGSGQSGMLKDLHEYGESGRSHHHNNEVNISAPGYNVYTTNWGNDINNDEYVGAWGTSFASPVVPSACALVASANPCLTATEIEDIVLQTADPNIYLKPENSPYIGMLGTGRLDVYEAVKRALELRTVFIQDETYSGVTITENSETIIKAGYQVTNTQGFGLVRILPNSNVTFEAPHSIVLSDGFEVKNEAFFEAIIIDSPCY